MAAAMALSVAGCAALGGSKPPPPTYDLTVPRYFVRAGHAPRGQLLIPEVTALSPLDTDKIVVRPAVGEVAAMADAQWSDQLTKLVQARTVQAFENASLLRAVGRPGDHITADYELLLDIRTFEISVPAGPAAKVEISAKLVSEESGRIVAGRIFRATVAAGATQGPAAVAALDAAFGRVVGALVVWTTNAL
jgi:cholesterol transport system auxiliary component